MTMDGIMVNQAPLVFFALCKLAFPLEYLFAKLKCINSDCCQVGNNDVYMLHMLKYVDPGYLGFIARNSLYCR